MLRSWARGLRSAPGDRLQGRARRRNGYRRRADRVYLPALPAPTGHSTNVWLTAPLPRLRANEVARRLTARSRMLLPHHRAIAWLPHHDFAGPASPDLHPVLRYFHECSQTLQAHTTRHYSSRAIHAGYLLFDYFARCQSWPGR